MRREDTVLVAILVVLHACLIFLLPGASSLSDLEISSLTGGLLNTEELVASMRTGSLMPHPLPFWLSARIWLKLSKNPWVLRLPSLLAGCLVIVMLVRVGSRHLGRPPGFAAAVLWACSPALGAMTRTFGPDLVLMAALLLAVDGFLTAWKQQGRRAWLTYLLAWLFILHWHAYAAFLYLLMWLAIGALTLWHGKLHRSREEARPPLGEAALATALPGLASVPLLWLVGRHAHLPPASGPVTAGQFYDVVIKAHGSGSPFGFALIFLAAVTGTFLGLKTHRIGLPGGRVILSTKTFVPCFLFAFVWAVYVPGLFAFHRATATSFSPGGVNALVPLFLLLAGVGITRVIPHALEGPTRREFAVTVLCCLLLAGAGWRASSGAVRTKAAIWEDAASYLDGKVREGHLVLVTPDEAKMYLLWASFNRPWAPLVRGESWLSRYDAGPNLERISSVWLCEASQGGGGKPRVRVSRLIKVGSLDIGTEESASYYVDGIDRKLERSEDPRQPFTFSWALGTRAKLSLPLEANRAASTFVFRASSFALPQRVGIDVNKRRKAEVEMKGGWRHYLVHFDQPEFLGGQYTRLDLHFATHRSPVAPDGSPRRMKAVALDYLALFSRQHSVSFPPEAPPETKEFVPGQTRIPPMGLQRGGRANPRLSQPR